MGRVDTVMQSTCITLRERERGRTRAGGMYIRRYTALHV